MNRLFARRLLVCGVLSMAGCGSSIGPAGNGSGGGGGNSGSGSGGSSGNDAAGTGTGGTGSSGSGGAIAPTGSGGAAVDAPADVGLGGAGGLADVTSDGDGDRVIGPTFTSDPLVTRVAGAPTNRSFSFTMMGSESTIYKGVNGNYSRNVSVHIPMQYDPAKPAALMVTQDAQESGYLPTVIDNLIFMKQVPVIVSVFIANGGGDSVGSERGLEYDTVSGLYAEFVMTEVIPRVITETKTRLMLDLKITPDPNGHATLGGSSGGAAAFSMAWWHPDLFRRVITFSGTYVDQVPGSSPFPHGCWVYHDVDPYDMTAPNGLVMHNCEAATGFTGTSKPAPCDIPLTQAKCEAMTGCSWNAKNNRPIRIWHQSSQNDLDEGENEPASDHRNFDLANRRMAASFKARGYHYHYDHANGAGHNDDRVQRQTIVEAMKWLWRGYPLE